MGASADSEPAAGDGGPDGLSDRQDDRTDRGDRDGELGGDAGQRESVERSADAAASDPSDRQPPSRPHSPKPAAPLTAVTISGEWPSSTRPGAGVAIENRMRRVQDAGAATVRVISPTPWFPSTHPAFGDLAAHAAAPRLEKRAKIVIHRPRFAVAPPAVGLWRARAIRRSLRPFLRRLVAKRGAVDLFDAHRLYPEAVATAQLAADFGVPYVVSVHSPADAALPDNLRVVEAVRAALAGAAGVSAPTQSLLDGLIARGARSETARRIVNGVDTSLFTPAPSDDARAADRAALGAPADAPLILALGDLRPEIGFDRAIAAVEAHPTAHLRIVGAGPARAALDARIRAGSAADRIRCVGARPHRDRAALFRAADLVLSPELDGWADYWVESLACGAPIVSAPSGSAREALTDPAAGRVARAGDPSALSDAIRGVLSAPPPREATRAAAKGFRWSDTVAGVETLFRAAVDADRL